MAVTVEYIIILTALVEQSSVPIKTIEITTDAFVLKDATGHDQYKAIRAGGGNDIVSEVIPDLTGGSLLRFTPSNSKLVVVGDDSETEIECEVIIPEE